jgi:hypothetical protein
MVPEAVGEAECLPADASGALTLEQQRRVRLLQERKDRFLYVDSAEAGFGIPSDASGPSAAAVQTAIADLLDDAIDEPGKELAGAHA